MGEPVSNPQLHEIDRVRLKVGGGARNSFRFNAGWNQSLRRFPQASGCRRLKRNEFRARAL